MPHDIFISYSHQDAAWMTRLSDDLRATGLTIWSDVSLNPGTESWRKSIEDAIDEAGCLVVIFSPDAKESKWVTAELDYAITQRKPIFPVLARGDEHDAVPFGFSTAQWIDIRESSRYPLEIPKLAEAVRSRDIPAHVAGHARSITPHVIPVADPDKLDPWNFLDQVRLLSWLFLSPQDYVQHKMIDKENLFKTGGWIISVLCWFPMLMPVIGYTMGTVQVSNPSTSSRFLLAAYAVYFAGWLICAVLAGRSSVGRNLFTFFLTTILSLMSFLIVGGVGNVLLVGVNDKQDLILLLTMCFSFGVAAGIAFVVSNGGTGVVAGVIVGSFIFLTLFKIPIGVAGGISGSVMGVTALVLSASLDQGLKRGQTSWLNRGILALLVIDYAVMFWIYLLGGWFVIAHL